MSDEGVNAMNNLAEAIKSYTLELKRQDKDRLLTMQDVSKEYNMSERVVARKIFDNPNVVVNRIGQHIVIKKAELDKYFDNQHS